MENIEKTEEQEEQETALFDKVKKFIDSKQSYFNIDKTDFIRSQNLQAGNGWFERLGRAWGEARSNLTINPLKPVVDSTLNSFIRNPFKFEGLSDEATSQINSVLLECLRDSCNDGVGYFCACHDEQGRFVYKRLSNQSIIYTDDMALTIDKKKGDGKTSSLWGSNTETLALATDEYPVLTFYEREGGIVRITQIEDDRIAARTELALPHLPIIPIRNKAILLKHETHWRGYYYEFQDAVALMNACLSKAAEIAIARTPVALSEESLAGNEEYVEQWQSNEPRNLYVYKAFEKSSINGVDSLMPLPPPAWAPNAQDMDVLQNQIATLKAHIDSSTGSNLASESSGAETATAVLLRRENKQAALSELLFNLQHSVMKLKEVLEHYNFILTGQRIEIKVIDQYQGSMNNQRALDLILQMQQAGIAPAMQRALLGLYGAPEEVLQAIDTTLSDPEKAAMQQANEQAQMQIQQLNNELMQARMLISSKEKEIETNKMIKLAELDLENKKLDFEYMKLGQQAALEKEKILR